MSNVIVDGFATYGTGNTTAVENALLAGAWASLDVSHDVDPLPWDANSGLYFAGTPGSAGGRKTGLRRALDTSLAVAILSIYYAVPSLPATAGVTFPVAFRDSDNGIIASLRLNTTGSMSLLDSAGTVLGTTDGPVIVAETATHLEMKVNITDGAFDLYVNGTQVLGLTGLDLGSSNIAQFSICDASPGATTQYFSHLIVRDTNGTVNNDITGDRKVATIFVASDDADNQGWAGHPLRRFGTGVLDLSVNNNDGVRCAATTDTDLGDGDFTIEGQVRFQTLPTGTNKAVLFSKWDEANNRRSWQLYSGGSDLENGNIVFRISTDGKSGTVDELISWRWVPELGRWYHVAVVRSSAEILLFIDGVQQGLPVADANTYFAGAALTSIGVQVDGNNPVANTSLDGWMDEFRLTVGVARYSANFDPPTDAFDRDADDPDWASVAWLSSFDDGVFDDSANGRTLTALGSAAMLTPDDGDHNFQVLDKPTPDDDTFIEAALIEATGTLTFSANATATKTVTVGTTDGSTAAVYTFVSSLAAAYDVLIGSDLATTMANLVAAINKGDGEGTAYGTGTLANADVSATLLPDNEVQVTALLAGADGNAIATSTTDTNASWGGTTLSGGQDIPAFSQFGFERLPSHTTIIDSITLVQRSWKTDSGTAKVQLSLIGPGGAAGAGTQHAISTVPTLYFDTIEADPDTDGNLSPTTITNGKVKINRTS